MGRFRASLTGLRVVFLEAAVHGYPSWLASGRSSPIGSRAADNERPTSARHLQTSVHLAA